MIEMNTYQALFDTALDGMLIIENGLFVHCNDAAVRLLGYSDPAALLQMHPSKISPPMQPDGQPSADKADAVMKVALETGQNRFEWVHWKADGSPIWVDVSLTCIVKQEQHIIHVVWHDIDAKKGAEEKLIQASKLTEEVINRFPVAIVRAESDNTSVGYFNQAFQRAFGWALSDIDTMEKWFARSYPDPDYRDQIMSRWEDLMTVTHDLNRVTSPYPVECNVTCHNGTIKVCEVWYHSSAGSMFGIFHDVTSQKAAELELIEKNIELEKLSQTDGLTGLLNRITVEKHIQDEIYRAERYDHDPLSIIIFDLDHFKAINDNYGHSQGDLVLRTVSNVIEASRRLSDKAGRWGGEEFMIVSPNTNLKGALKLAEHLRQAIAALPFEKSGPVTSSFGVATYLSGETVEQFVARADMQLYAAKHSGRNCVVG